MLREVLTESIFGIKLMQLTYLMVLTYLIKGMFYKFFLLSIFLLYTKISENTDVTYYKKKRDLVLNKAKDYYKNNKETSKR